jgi:toxin CcdB
VAKFDVYLSAEGMHWLDCQANLFSDLNSRFVVPLLSPDQATPVDSRLNPTFQFEGTPLVMMTHFASAVPVRELGQRADSLQEEEYRIGAALDMLISGF